MTTSAPSPHTFKGIPYKDLPFGERLGHLPGSILLSLARNESASREERKAAVEFLIDKGFPEAGHPDLVMLAREVQQEREARRVVEAAVESALEGEIPQHEPVLVIPFREVSLPPTLLPPTLYASVTTASLQQPEVCPNKSSFILPGTEQPT